MSRPTLLPIRLATQCSRQQPTQCLRQRQRHSYISLDDQRRAFATTPQRCAGAVKQMKPSMKQAAQPSMSRTQKEQQAAMARSGQLPEDVGLLPDTFILPRKPSERYSWRLRKKWFKTRFWEAVNVVMYKTMLVRPRPTLALGSIPKTAADLHSKLMTAFASGDMAPIARNNLACSGLLSSLRGRLSTRAPGTSQSWSIVRHISSPRLVSYKAAAFPGPPKEPKDEKNVQVQAVVRLHTLQRLQNLRQETRRVGRELVTEMVREGRATEKESVEYVVVQKATRRGKEGKWTVWGFAEETSLAKVEQLEGASQARRGGHAKLS